MRDLLFIFAELGVLLDLIDSLLVLLAGNEDLLFMLLRFSCDLLLLVLLIVEDFFLCSLFIGFILGGLFILTLGLFILLLLLLRLLRLERLLEGDDINLLSFSNEFLLLVYCTF